MDRLFVVMCAALLMVAAQPRAQQNTAALEKLFASAEYKATVRGDLKAAIEDYKRIVETAGQDRRAAALALLRMGTAYQRLGDQQAEQVFRRILSEYREQPAAAEAESAINRGVGPRKPPVPAVSPLWTTAGNGMRRSIGRISRDGRWLPYTDWTNLFVRDLVAGRDIQVTDGGVQTPIRDQQYPQFSLFSPDGRMLAFNWFNSERYEIRVGDFNQTGLSHPVTLYHNIDVEYIEPVAWSPDGARLAVSVQRVDRTGQIALLSLRDGVLTTLKSFPWRGAGANMAFSPDGKFLAYDLLTEDEPRQKEVYVMALADSVRETAVTSHRRNDHVVTWSRDGRHIIFSSDRTGSAQLWAQEVSGLQVKGTPRVIPSSFSGSLAGVSEDGRLFDVLTTYSASLFRTVDFDYASGRATSAPADPGEEYLSFNATSHADWSPDGTRLLLVRRTGGDPGGNLITVLGPDGKKLHDVQPQLHSVAINAMGWASDGKSVYASGRDLNERSGIFEIDLLTGVSTNIVSAASDEPPMNNYWFIAQAPGPDEIYYGHNSATGFRLAARNLRTGNERDIAAFPSPNGWLSPTVWDPYASPDRRHIVIAVPKGNGRRSLVVVSVSTGEQRELAAPQGAGTLMWTPDSGAVVVRRSQADGNPEVLRVDVTTGEARKLDWNLGADNRDFRVHPDGRRLVYVVNAETAQGQLRVHTNVLDQLNAERPVEATIK